MKKAITLLALVTSFQSFAHGPSPLLITTALPLNSTVLSTGLTTGNFSKSTAVQIQDDSQAYITSGVMSPFLNQAIKDARAEDSQASDEEVLDALLTISEQLLN